MNPLIDTVIEFRVPQIEFKSQIETLIKFDELKEKRESLRELLLRNIERGCEREREIERVGVAGVEIRWLWLSRSGGRSRESDRNQARVLSEDED